MGTSNSTDFSRNRDQIIRDAYELLGIISLGDNLSSEDIGKGSTLLNLMIKSWEADGIYIWAETLGTIFYVPDQIEYTLGGSNGDHSSNDYIQTALSSAASTSATSLNLDSTTGMTVGDYIGIKLDSGALHWTTIVTIPTSTSVTITSGVASACAVDNVVYTYTTRMGKPLHITAARRRDSFGLDIKVNIDAWDDYFYYPNKSARGTVTCLQYTPYISTGVIRLYQAPSRVDEVLQISYFRSIQDFDNSTDDPDFPVEWYATIMWNLAIWLAPGAGKDSKIATLTTVAEPLYQKLREWSHDHTYIKTAPAFDNY